MIIITPRPRPLLGTKRPLLIQPRIKATGELIPLDHQIFAAQAKALTDGLPLDPLAPIGLHESGNNYTIGVGGVSIANYPLSSTGFPNWPGSGNSHAAGKYQFEPGTWNPYAAQIGVWDFSPESQDAIAAICYNDQGFAPWEPYDAPLAAYIASVGGPGAFYQPGDLPLRLAAAL